MSDFGYAPEMQDPGDGDMLGALADVVCEHAGHTWVDAGGGMDICGVCQAMRDAPADAMPCPAAGGVPCLSHECLLHGCEEQR